MGRPRGCLAREQGQGFQTAIAVPISLTIADGGLTQQVNRPGSPMLPKIGQPRRRFLYCRSGNEGARHVLDLASDRLAAEPSPQAGGGKGFDPPLAAEEWCVSITHVLASQHDHLLVVCDRGQDINESKQLCLEEAVLHGQVEGRLRPPAALKECRSSAGRETSELFTDTVDRRFERGRNCRHLHPHWQSDERTPSVYTASILLKRLHKFGILF